jgi:hypothetical protein
VRFAAEVISAGGGGHAVRVPSEVALAFNSRRPAVLALVNGVSYRSRLLVYGGTTYLGLRVALLRQLGVGVGDEVQIELSEEVAAEVPTVVEEPVGLTTALGEHPAAREAYAALTEADRAEYSRWIASAEPPEREQRIARLLRRLTT